MALYIAPFNYETNNSVLSLKDIGLSCLFYKSKEGPLGLAVNNESDEILYNLIKDCTWFSVEKSTFYELNESIFEKNKYSLKGLIFLDKDEFAEEISSGIEILKVKDRNKLLSKYNKELLPILPNIILDCLKDAIYDKALICKVLLNKNVLLWNWAEFGGHIVFHNFKGCLLDKYIKNLEEEVIIESSINNIPSW